MLRSRASLVALAIGAVILTGCIVEPPPPPPVDPAVEAYLKSLADPTDDHLYQPPPPPTTTAPPPPSSGLPAAPTGVAAPALVDMDSPDPNVLTVTDPQYCGEPAPPTATTPTPGTAPCYYAYTTQVIAPPFVFIVSPVWRSYDLSNWDLVDAVNGSAIKFPDHYPSGPGRWAKDPFTGGGDTWAPSVLYRPGNPPSSRFVMWYTARDAASGHPCLTVATSAHPAGPFVDSTEQPKYCQHQFQGTIDASPFVDDNGALYLLYRAQVPAQLFVQQLDASGMNLIGSERLLWSGGGPAPDAPVVEGPTMIRVNGQYYLLYSIDDWYTARYRVGVLRCDSPLGPCRAMYSTANLASRDAMVGPGGQTPFRDAAGNWRVVFHAWTAPHVPNRAGLYTSPFARTMRILPLTIDSNVRIG